MKSITRTRHGFTLIELLIVIAIILILISIALPNFLAAQIRAKISNVRGAMRTMQTAQEAYYQDWGQYVVDNYWGSGPGTDVDSFRLLTSPVEYISEVPSSPFLEMNQGDDGHYYFEYWQGGFWGPGGSFLYDRGSEEYSILYRICSYGPDGEGQYGEPPWWENNSPHDIHFKTQAYLLGLYSPTNGVRSMGDLLHSNQGAHVD